MKKGYITTYMKTFIILVIIVAVCLGTIYFIKNQYDEEKFETIKTNMLLIEAKTKIVEEKVRIKEKDVSYVGRKIEDLQEEEEIKKLIEDNIVNLDKKDVQYYVLEQSNLEELGLATITLDNDFYIVEYTSNEIIYSKGIENKDGDIVYKLSDIKEDKQEEQENNEEGNVSNEDENKENKEDK